MDKLIWSGVRASDVRYADALIENSVTIFGENDGVHNRAYCASHHLRLNHNRHSPEASDFILQQQLEILSHTPDARFMAYNPNCVFGADARILSHTVCLNDETLMKTLNNKIAFREWGRKAGLSLRDYHVVKGRDIQSVAAAQFGTDSIVVQHPGLSGGEGTFVVRGDASHTLDLPPEQDYVITRYAEKNVPVNMHCVIYGDGFLLLPPSVQLIRKVEGFLLYRGADFLEYKRVGAAADAAFRQQAALLCAQLLSEGYRGVLGIDAILSEGTVAIQEVNNRFQGSTYPLNIALRDAGLPSVQELNYRAFFEGTKPSNADVLEALPVPYSYLVVAAEGEKPEKDWEYARHILRKLKEGEVAEALCYEDDGLSFDADIERWAPLFEAVFKVNIVSILDDGEGITTRLHPYFIPPSQDWIDRIRHPNDLTALKTALINEGVALTPALKAHLSAAYGLEEAFSLDLKLRGEHYVNCPTALKLIALSPFGLDWDGKDFVLTYYGKPLMPVEYLCRTVLPQSATEAGARLSDIVYFSTDRLRLQHSPLCVFGSTEALACRFCETYGTKADFSPQDIDDAIDICFEQRPLPFRHVLIGGRSGVGREDKSRILSMCKRIRAHSGMPIYLMCLPPDTLSDIDDYREAGVTEFGFNMEVFDRRLARLYMPGKGHIPAGRYLEALAYAAERAGKQGEVRCAFIVGLEPLESLLEGVEAVCRAGAAPILSAFRPIYGTAAQSLAQIPSADLYEALLAAEALCGRYGLSLGPQCRACRNNTLNLL